MRSGCRIAAVALLALLEGCGRKQNVAPPPQAAQAPSLPPSQMAQLIPAMPPPLPPAATRTLKLDTTVPPETAAVAPARPKRAVKHHAKPAPQETAQQDAKPPADAPPAAEPPATPPATSDVASAQPSEMSPIGQLSTTNENANTADRSSISDQIEKTEMGLNGIKRSLSADEQKTAAQIRSFITKARDALKADDLDGARTLSTKARLLLDELTKE
jgi:hypothetical protein